MIDELNTILETIAYIIVIGEAILKAFKWLKREKAPQNRRKRSQRRRR